MATSTSNVCAAHTVTTKAAYNSLPRPSKRALSCDGAVFFLGREGGQSVCDRYRCGRSESKRHLDPPTSHLAAVWVVAVLDPADPRNLISTRQHQMGRRDHPQELHRLRWPTTAGADQQQAEDRTLCLRAKDSSSAVLMRLAASCSSAPLIAQSSISGWVSLAGPVQQASRSSSSSSFDAGCGGGVCKRVSALFSPIDPTDESLLRHRANSLLPASPICCPLGCILAAEVGLGRDRAD